MNIWLSCARERLAKEERGRQELQRDLKAGTAVVSSFSSSGSKQSERLLFTQQPLSRSSKKSPRSPSSTKTLQSLAERSSPFQSLPPSFSSQTSNAQSSRFILSNLATVLITTLLLLGSISIPTTHVSIWISISLRYAQHEAGFFSRQRKVDIEEQIYIKYDQFQQWTTAVINRPQLLLVWASLMGRLVFIMFNLKTHGLAHISIDCIKACPFKEDLFALAYYQTNPDTQGAIAVARLSESHHITTIQPLASPPLLHITWTASINNPANYLLVAASRTNDVLIYQYDPNLASLSLLKTVTIGEGIFCLYLDIKTKQDHYQLLVSSNESTVFDLILNSNFDIVERKTYSKHQYAVWTCRIDPKSQIFVCGDEVNSIYMYRQGKLVAKNSKAHNAGICDLTLGQNYELYTGGFDGVVTQLDTRKFDQCVYRHDWGGTIWRVIPNKAYNQLLLCNSSEKKFQIVDQSLGKELWNSGNGHDSLAYAADWGKDKLITASFYDKKICYWGKEE